MKNDMQTTIVYSVAYTDDGKENGNYYYRMKTSTHDLIAYWAVACLRRPVDDRYLHRVGHQMKSAWRVAIDRTLPPKFSRAPKPKCEGCQECMTRTVNKLWVPSATQTQLL